MPFLLSSYPPPPVPRTFVRTGSRVSIYHFVTFTLAYPFNGQRIRGRSSQRLPLPSVGEGWGEGVIKECHIHSSPIYVDDDLKDLGNHTADRAAANALYDRDWAGDDGTAEFIHYGGFLGR